MNVIELKNKQGSLNKIEEFIEEICDGLNIGDTFLGNMLIAITEVVNIIEMQNSGVKISFLNEPRKFTFIFSHFSKNFNMNYLKSNIKSNDVGNFEMEDSLLMVNALCDDLNISDDKKSLILIFINSGVDEVVSNHRKEYLNNFLNQSIKV